jgi:hypothetical protein
VRPSGEDPPKKIVNTLSKKMLFQAYVEAFPLDWNLHFFPQSVYCNGLGRRINDYVRVMQRVEGDEQGSTVNVEIKRSGASLGLSIKGGADSVLRRCFISTVNDGGLAETAV